MEALSSITIDLGALEEGLQLIIDERSKGSLFDVSDASEHNEARYQLVEGHFYDFSFSNPAYSFQKDSEQIVQPHKRNPHLGTLAPNIYVGTLTLPVFRKEQEVRSGAAELPRSACSSTLSASGSSTRR